MGLQTLKQLLYLRSPNRFGLRGDTQAANEDGL